VTGPRSFETEVRPIVAVGCDRDHGCDRDRASQDLLCPSLSQHYWSIAFLCLKCVVVTGQDYLCPSLSRHHSMLALPANSLTRTVSALQV
jgi:hypothetical protein